MREAHPVERAVGIGYYVSDAAGVGGRLRESPADFRVVERELFDAEPADADAGAYPHLVVRVRLRGWDTNDFAGGLSDRLGISRERVSWAGTKDKHADTTQLFTVEGIGPGELPSVPDADIEVVGRAGRPILFGDLAGNRFEVTVRDPDAPDNADRITAELRAFAGVLGDAATDLGDADADSAVQEVNRNGDRAESVGVAVPNYFGQQRFGSRRPVTHEVGLAAARGDWAGAVLAYVGNPSPREPERTQTARAFVEESRDWAAALQRYPRQLGHERAMLQRLADADGPPGPETFRSALEAVPTNLQRLFVNAAQSYVFNRVLSERLERGLPFEYPVAGDTICFLDRDAGPGVPDADRTQRVTEGRLDAVRRHCERGRAFVTAPLVGTETDIAGGEPGEIERAVLSEVGVEPADFDLPGEFHSTGTRRAVAVPTALSVERDPLRFSFALPRGSYATVLLREYLKTDPEAL